MKVRGITVSPCEVVVLSAAVTAALATACLLLSAAELVNVTQLASFAQDVPAAREGSPLRSAGRQENLAEGFDWAKGERHTLNPHMHLQGDVFGKLIDFVNHIAKKAHNSSGRKLNLLDIGGNSGKGYERKVAALVNYTSLDFTPPPDRGNARNIVVGNVQKYNSGIADGSFDVITAFNVFEHLVAPWIAAEEMKRWVRESGFIIVAVPFSWRYHAYPMDAYRYTHTGMRYLFESKGGCRTLYTAYAQYGKTVHGHYKDKSDEPPSDKQLIEQVELLWIGQRDRSFEFDTESLDFNSAFSRPIAAGLP